MREWKSGRPKAFRFWLYFTPGLGVLTQEAIARKQKFLRMASSGKFLPDFVKLAEAYGAVGMRIEKPEELRSKLQEAFSIPRPVFVDVIVNEEEKVFPMVPAGAGIADMLIES